MISWQTILQIAEEQAAPLTTQTNEELRKDCLFAYEQQQQQLSNESTREETSSSIYERLEMLEKTWSTQKADLDRQIADQSCTFALVIKDLQEEFLAMLMDARNEVRHDTLSMMRSTLFDQTVAGSTKLTKMVAECQDETLVQEPAACSSQTAKLACDAKPEVSDTVHAIALPTLSEQPSTRTIPRLANDSAEPNESYIERLCRLEEQVVKLAEEFSWQLSHAFRAKACISTQSGKSPHTTDLCGNVGPTPGQKQESMSLNRLSEILQSEHAQTSRTSQRPLQHGLNSRSKGARWKKRHQRCANCLRGTAHSRGWSSARCTTKIHIAI